jgi:ATP-dependent Lon protease
MKEAVKTAEAYLRANLKNLGITKDAKSYDFAVQAINLHQAKEGAETAVAFFASLVSALLDRPLREQLVVLGEMSVSGLLLKVANLTERLQLAMESGAKTVLIPSENKRDLADVPDEVLNKIQTVFYTDPTNAVLRALGLE